MTPIQGRVNSCQRVNIEDRRAEEVTLLQNQMINNTVQKLTAECLVFESNIRLGA